MVANQTIYFVKSFFTCGMFVEELNAKKNQFFYPPPSETSSG